MRFYSGSLFPSDYRDQILIAEHGSWTCSEPPGYRLTRVRLEGDRAVSSEVFAGVWLQDGGAWGRPVDLQVMPDGVLLGSDDKAGAVYRVTAANDPEKTTPVCICRPVSYVAVAMGFYRQLDPSQRPPRKPPAFRNT